MPVILMITIEQCENGFHELHKRKKEKRNEQTKRPTILRQTNQRI